MSQYYNENYEVQSLDEITLENYMPYAVHVILDRAVPMIDGLKPSQRRILYTMYMQKLLNKKVKSAVVVGETMKIHPHGDMAIYETLVRMADSHEAWGAPLIRGKGNLGKLWSEMSPAAYRYTECGLDSLAKEYFEDLDYVEFIPTHDESSKEPLTLAPKFPALLTNTSSGIAVGMTSDIPAYNFKELLEWTINYITSGKIPSILIPDFATGGCLLFNENEIRNIFLTGKGTINLRAKYKVIGKTIQFYDIPYGATFENIVQQIANLVNNSKIKYIENVSNDIEKDSASVSVEFSCSNRELDNVVNYILLNLFKETDLEKSYSALMRVVTNKGELPETMSVPEIVDAWLDHRKEILTKRFKAEVKSLENDKELLEGMVKFLGEENAVKTFVNILVDDGQEPAEIYLRRTFEFSQRVIDNILNMKVKALTNLELKNVKGNLEKVLSEIQVIEYNLNNLNLFIVKQLRDLIRNYPQFGTRKTSVVTEYTRLQDITPTKRVREMDKGNYKVIITPENFIKKVSATSNVSYNEDTDLYFECKGTDVLLLFCDGELFKLYIDEIEAGDKNTLGVFIPKLYDLSNMNIQVVSKMDPKLSTLLISDNGKIVKVDHADFVSERRLSKIQRGFKAFDDSEIIFTIDVDFNATETNLYKFIGKYEGAVETVPITTIKFKSRLGSTKIFMEKMTDKKLDEVQVYQ